MTPSVRIILIAAIAVKLAPGQIVTLASNLNQLEARAVIQDASGAFYAAGTNAWGYAHATPGAYQTQPGFGICGYTNFQFLAIPVYCSTGVIAKFSPTGQIIWVTYLGGLDQPNEQHSDTTDTILLDSHGNVWVSGHVETLNFPITANAYQKIPTGFYLAELSPDGSRLLYSTYSSGELLAIDQNDCLYLGGISKFDPYTNRIIYTVPAPVLTPVAGALDANGAFYIAGYGPASGFPITPGAYSHSSSGTDILLMGIDPVGQMIFSTAIGGAGNDVLTAMARDDTGNFYLTGIQQPISSSTNLGPFPDFPVTKDTLQTTWNPAFLLKLSADASTLVYGTFLGKSNVEPRSLPALQPAGIKIGPDGKLRMIAVSSQSDLALTPDSFQPCYRTLLGETQQYVMQRWTYLQFSSDLGVIDYAAAIPGIDTQGKYHANAAQTGYVHDTINGPFSFDTEGNVEYVEYSPELDNYVFKVMNVAQSPPPGPVCMADYITQTTTPVVPGLLATILGPGIGPAQQTPLALDASGKVATQLAGVQVFVGDLPAPILSAGPSRIDFVVPYRIPADGTSIISVFRDGNLVGKLTNTIAPASPKLFTVDGTGFGAAAWNQDGTPNSPSNPAHPGDIVTFYGTGFGRMLPVPDDGAIPQSPHSHLVATIGMRESPNTGIGCGVVYSGDAPGMVEGISQLNCEVGAFNTPPIPFYIFTSTVTAPFTPSPPLYMFYVGEK